MSYTLLLEKKLSVQGINAVPIPCLSEINAAGICGCDRVNVFSHRYSESPHSCNEMKLGYGFQGEDSRMYVYTKESNSGAVKKFR